MKKIVFILVFLLVFTSGSIYTFHKIKKSHDIEQVQKVKMSQEADRVQKIFENEAKRFQRKLSDPNLTHDQFQRCKEIADLLANGVFDEKVVIYYARVSPPFKTKYGHPLFKNCPALVWVTVDELKRAAFVYYSDSNDPNAFGNPLFAVGDYYHLRNSELRNPKTHWIIPLKCYGETKKRMPPHRRLMKYDTGMYNPEMTLELNVFEWNAMLAGKGQFILRDNMNNELDRVKLKPVVDKDKRKELENLMLPIPQKPNEPNSVGI